MIMSMNRWNVRYVIRLQLSAILKIQVESFADCVFRDIKRFSDDGLSGLLLSVAIIFKAQLAGIGQLFFYFDACCYCFFFFRFSFKKLPAEQTGSFDCTGADDGNNSIFELFHGYHLFNGIWFGFIIFLTFVPPSQPLSTNQ
jgi:hypothetical protein